MPLGRHDDAATQATPGAAAGHFAALDLGLASRLPPHPPLAPPADTAQARFQLFDAIAGFWQRAAARQPLLLVLDDLHCSDVPSLRLLEFVARESARLKHMNVRFFTHGRAAKGRTAPSRDAAKSGR